MSLRETLNRNPAITTAGTIAIIALALAAIVWQLLPRAREPDTIHTRGFYTTDDGATYFADELDKVSPFTVDGKDAYRAWVFQCGWGKPFVGYMARFTPEMKTRIENALAQGRDIPELVRLQGEEYKRPKDAQWIAAMSEEAKRYVWITCSDGKTPAKGVWPD